MYRVCSKEWNEKYRALSFLVYEKGFACPDKEGCGVTFLRQSAEAQSALEGLIKMSQKEGDHDVVMQDANHVMQEATTCPSCNRLINSKCKHFLQSCICELTPKLQKVRASLDAANKSHTSNVPPTPSSPSLTSSSTTSTSSNTPISARSPPSLTPSSSSSSTPIPARSPRVDHGDNDDYDDDDKRWIVPTKSELVPKQEGDNNNNNQFKQCYVTCNMQSKLLHYNKFDPVNLFKTKVCLSFDVKNPEDYILLWTGVLMVGDHKMDDYKLGNNTTLRLVKKVT